MKHAVLGLLLVPLTAAPAIGAAPASQGDVTSLVQELKTRGDDAKADTVRKLADLRTKEALDALFEVYDVMQSIYMRREVLRGMAEFDAVAGEERRALQKLMDVATEAQDRELREAAVDLLAGCDNYGKAFLAMIVESAADDDVREQAMLYHTGRTRDTDFEWYKTLYQPQRKETRKSRRGDDEVGEQVAHTLPAIRYMAFEAIAGKLELEEVRAALSDRSGKVRIRALQELEARGDEEVLEVAEDIYDQVGYLPEHRLVCAQILARDQGIKIADRLLKDAGKATTSEYLAFGIADILAGFDDPGLNKKLLRGVGRGRGFERVLSVRLCRHIQDEDLEEKLVKLLRDKDERVVDEVLAILAERKVASALPELEKLVEKSKDGLRVTAALDAIYAIRGNDPEWIERLMDYVSSGDPDIRNSALEAIGRSRNPRFMEPLLLALDHELWSTRLAAARGLERMRQKEAVGALCSRIGKETGRMAHELAEILWRLTGKPFRTSGGRWKDWWDNEGAGFELVSESELRKIEREEEERRLRQISKTSFFGIRIESERVIFIIDVSGSMGEPTRGRYVGSDGPRRMDVAKRELVRCLEALDKKSLFNIVPFSDFASQWRKSITERTPEALEEAKDFLTKVDANGGTNLFGALRMAFEDHDVDTIFVLSDGEPTVGEITDGNAIRASVAKWNKHRGVKLHCIAVGGSLQVLEWLAKDTGGRYVKYP